MLRKVAYVISLPAMAMWFFMCSGAYDDEAQVRVDHAPRSHPGEYTLCFTVEDPPVSTEVLDALAGARIRGVWAGRWGSR